MAGVTEDLGPVTTVTVEGYVEEEEGEEAVEVEMHLLDWPQALYKFLRVGTENPPQDTIFPHNENEMVRTVNIDQLATLAREWVQTGDNTISEAYATAVEGPPGAAAAGATARGSHTGPCSPRTRPSASHASANPRVTQVLCGRTHVSRGSRRSCCNSS